VSCKETSLARDLPFFVAAGYEVKKVKCVDLFLHARHVETVILMMRCGQNDK
jgi:tRNA/tmRNA/rRNA uracil-C5-methylase (TrmA/RlmC/RlmD family)